MRTVFGDHQRFVETYLYIPGQVFLRDGCRRDEDGYYWITGRVDDVNVSGHRMEPQKSNRTVAHAKVAEAAVAGAPQTLRGRNLRLCDPKCGRSNIGRSKV